MNVEEYTQLLRSDSPTIEFHTKNGKTITCQKEADEMDVLLKRSGETLQATVEQEDTPLMDILHQLRGLAIVLDQLKPQEETSGVGDNGIKPAQGLGSQVETIPLTDGSEEGKSRRSPAVSQAISICGPIVSEYGSDSAKKAFIEVVGIADRERRDTDVAQLLTILFGAFSEL
jgi:hypothetical protein